EGDRGRQGRPADQGDRRGRARRHLRAPRLPGPPGLAREGGAQLVARRRRPARHGVRMTSEPVIAIVGGPNVGKSTLFNRLVGGRPALVHDTPGVTRDRRYGSFDFDGRRFRVIDTGGLDPDARREAIGAGIHRQAELAMSEADAVVFVVDAVTGPTPVDIELAERLRVLGRPVFVAANKVDHPKRDVLAAQAYELGL